VTHAHTSSLMTLNQTKSYNKLYKPILSNFKMEGKTVIILILIGLIIILIPILIFVSIKFSVKTSPQPTSINDCKTLTFNGKDKTNILFISSKNDGERYRDFFLSTPPYDENKDSFNFYYIDSYDPECEIYQGIAVLCKGKELIKRASVCPNDFIIAIKNLDDGSIRSSTFNNIISINSKHPLTVLTHEFAHAYANLADEYAPATIPAGSRNCVTSCDKFPKDIDGCFDSCSDSSHFRSIENGLMRTLSSNDYGIFNKKLILEIIKRNNPSTTGTGSAISDPSQDCSAQSYYLIEGYTKNDILTINSVTIQPNCASTTLYGDYHYEIINNGQITETKSFYANRLFIEGPSSNSAADPGTIEGGGLVPYEGEIYFTIPYSNNMEEIRIVDNENNLVRSIQVKELNSQPCLII